jgi:hypothetical protein
MEEENNKKGSFFHRLVAGMMSRDFWVPRSLIDVLFILICFVLAWYAITYDIPNAKVPVICANYWNRWANQYANYLTGINATEQVTNFVLKNMTIDNNFSFGIPH